MTTTPAPMAPGEVVVVITGTQPDPLGRIEFLAYWHDPAKPAGDGPPDYVPGQVFCTSVRDFSAERAAEGVRVTILNPGVLDPAPEPGPGAPS